MKGSNNIDLKLPETLAWNVPPKQRCVTCRRFNISEHTVKKILDGCVAGKTNHLSFSASVWMAKQNAMPKNAIHNESCNLS